MPQLFQCVSCGKECTEEESYYFSQEQHGILCRRCSFGKGSAVRISSAALYAMQYMAGAVMGKLFLFTVTEDVLRELEFIIHTYTSKNTDRRFKSLEILEMMC